MNLVKKALLRLHLTIVMALVIEMCAQSVGQVQQSTPLENLQTGWQMSQLNSPMGDNSGIVLHAKQLPGEAVAPPSENTGLKIQCSKKKGLEVVLHTDLILHDSGTINDTRHRGTVGGMFSKHANQSLSPVRVRFGQQKIRSEEWVMGADSSNLFAQKPKSFVDDILRDQVHDVLIEAHPANGNPVVFKFDVGGLSEYKAKLHEACGY